VSAPTAAPRRASPAHPLPLGPDGRASAPAAYLAALAPGPGLDVEAWVRPRDRAGWGDVVYHCSARGAYRLSLDPVGSVGFAPGLPRSCVMVPRMEGFPADALTVELIHCPFRAGNGSTLLSYAATGEAGWCDFAVHETGAEGIVVTVAGHAVATGIHHDYAQWQRLAITWRSDTGELVLYRDDRDATIAAAMAGAPAPPLGPPRFRANVARGQRLADGGSLVIGQAQARRADPASFPPERAYAGSVREARLWRGALGAEALEALGGAVLRGDESCLVADWRFTQLALECGEALNACGTERNLALLSGPMLRAGVRDVRAYRLVGAAGGQAVASRTWLPALRWSRVALRHDGSAPPELWVDDEPADAAALDPLRAPRAEAQGFHVGPLEHAHVAEVRVTPRRASGHATTSAHYPGTLTANGLLEDISGNGLHLPLHGRVAPRRLTAG
jgi:hypothetical protein